MQKLTLAPLLLATFFASACAVDMEAPIEESGEFESERRINTLRDLTKHDRALITNLYSDKLAGTEVRSSSGVTKFAIEPDEDAACWSYPGNVGCWFGEWLVSCEKNANTGGKWDCGVTHEDELD